jgi:hypothetical protein
MTKKKTFPKIRVYQFGPTPDVEFEKGNILAGFNEDDLGMDDYKSARSLRLYKALGLPIDNPELLDDDMVLGTLPGGRWALVGLTVDGHEFAVEERRPTTKPVPTKRPRLDRPVYFRTTAGLLAALERVAAREQRTIASVIRIAVEQYVKRGEK